jgi:hypothetical protein
MSDSMNQTRTFEVLTAEPVRNRRRPRDGMQDEKARIVAASLQPEANVSAVVDLKFRIPRSFTDGVVRRLRPVLFR